MQPPIAKTENPKPAKRSRQVIYRRDWLLFVKNIDRHGVVSFALEFYIPVNRRFSKTISFDEKKAIAIWYELYEEVPPIEYDELKEQWINSRVVSPPRRNHGARKFPLIQFGPSPLGQKFEDYCKLQWEKPISRGTKSVFLRICRDLLKLSGKSETLTNTAVKAYFKARMHPKRHKSPETLKSDKTEIRRLATWLGIRDLEGLFKDVYIPSRAQLQDHGIEFGSLNRRHLERPEVENFIYKIVNYNNPQRKPERDSLIVQLLLGTRPQEAPCAEILATSIVISGSWKYGKKKSLKTARKGVDTIIIPKTPVIDAILFLTDCKPAPVVTENGSDVFQEIAMSALGKAGQDLDRYCLRHTALTWLVLTPGLTSKEVGDMAGHMGARMIQDVYASRRVRDQRSWEEAMPLAIRDIPRTWHGFLLECIMQATWPSLKSGRKPDDPKFQQLGKILKGSKKKREELDLF